MVKKITTTVITNIDPTYKEKIIGILTVLFPKAKVYLYGSRARSTHQRASDIDIAIDIGHSIPFEHLSEADAILKDLNIPYGIDLVDFNLIPQAMREIILKEGIIWKD